MEFVTIPVVLVVEFYFYMHHPIKASLFQNITFELVYLCILTWSQNLLGTIKVVISLKKMVILSVK